jgi:hypothetical protein
MTPYSTRKQSRVQTCEVAAVNMASQLRNVQAKLGELQDRIDRRDKTLEQLIAEGK